jgi:hypothetical protein
MSGPSCSDVEKTPEVRSGSEVQARLEAERSGRPFIVLRDGSGSQRIVALDAERTRRADDRAQR